MVHQIFFYFGMFSSSEYMTKEVSTLKVKNLILKLHQLEQESDIFYCDENEGNYQLIIIENQEKNGKGEISTYYTIEKY